MSNFTAGGKTATGADKNILTNLRQEKGRISTVITERINKSNPFLAVMSRTKEFFPSAMGDVLRKVIHNINRPNERDVLAWQRVGGASPGFNPQNVTYKPIPYGESEVSACLYQDGWMSPEFGVVDLSFKHVRDQRLGDIIETMTTWTEDIWGHWSVQAFQHSVQCVSLSSLYGHPEELGEYPSINPTTPLTYNHCDLIYMRVRDEGAERSPTVEGYQLIFIGDEEYKFLIANYYDQARASGYSPTVASMAVPMLGKVDTIDNFMFVRNRTPRRFRARVAGETWDDAIIPSTITVDGVMGTRTVRNPDYYNRNIAKYTETIFFNEDAADWLVPSEAMAGGDQWFRAQNFSGDFELFNERTDNDPKAKNAKYYADYMAGMIACFPKRARCVISQYPGTQAIDVCAVGCGEADLSEATKYFVRECSKPAGTTDRVQLYVSGDTIANTPPDNHSLYLVTKGGNKFLVDDLISQTAVTGSVEYTDGGISVVLEVADALASCRAECDAWDYLAFLPSTTPVSDTTIAGCGGCSPTAGTACTWTYTFSSVDGPIILQAGDDGADIIVGDLSSPTASAFQTAVQTAIDAFTGTHTATVVKDGLDWVLTIVGPSNADLVGSYVSYDGGVGYPAQATVVQSGDCTA